jgi:hypothetical protein
MLSSKDSNTSGLEAGFENLWQLALLEGIQREVIEHLGYAFVLSAISEVNKPIAMANAMPKFFGYLVGPGDVKMRKSDERDMIAAIDALEFAHSLSVEENKNYKILKAIKSALSDFMMIAIKYHSSRVFSKARRTLNEVDKSSFTKYDKHDKTLPNLKREIETLRKEMRKELKKERLSWKM